MQIAIYNKGKEVMVDVTAWESTMNNRIEYYAVFTGQQETFVNFVKHSGQSLITEESSSKDLTADIKDLIKEKLVTFYNIPINNI
jgi:hypothetical protein